MQFGTLVGDSDGDLPFHPNLPNPQLTNQRHFVHGLEQSRPQFPMYFDGCPQDGFGDP
jgi:hypothetical protein